MSIEYFRDIPGYEGLYQVSNYGRVKNVKFNRVLSIATTKLNPYPRVTLSKNGKHKTKMIHILVAQAFIPNPKKLPQVNHKDENKTNNFVWVNPDGSIDPDKSNLEWCDAKYNINYGDRNNKVASKMTNGKLSKKVIQMTLDGTIVKKWPSTFQIERELGIDQAAISRVCNGKQKTSYGYKWRYA